MKGAHLFKHGLSTHPLYGRWRGMIQRCTDPNHKNYHQYGGRGITVCLEWRDFPTFLRDMGEPLPGQSLERKDGAKGYSPDNCVWASQSDQMKNTSNTRRISFNGETKCLKEWADAIGINKSTLRTRLAKWPLDKALAHHKFRTNGEAA